MTANLSRAGDCVCGVPVEFHFTERNVKVSCSEAAKQFSRCSSCGLPVKWHYIDRLGRTAAITNRCDVARERATAGVPLCRCPEGVCYLHPSVSTCSLRGARTQPIGDAHIRSSLVESIFHRRRYLFAREGGLA